MADKSLDHSAFSSNNNLQQAEDSLYVSLCKAHALTQVALGKFSECDQSVVTNYICTLDDLVEDAMQALSALQCENKRAKEVDSHS
jgi:hypothetical protein